MEEKTEKKGNKAKAAKAGSSASFVRELLSGTMISEKLILNNLGYITFVTFLLAIYIGNRFNAEKVTRESTRLQREVKDLKAESLSISSELVHSSRQSEVYRLIREKGLNLEELKTPPYKILVSRK